MNGLPQNWGIAEIRDVSILTKHVDPQSLFNESFKYVDISSIDSNIFKVVDAKLININEAPSRARQLIKKNDIVFSTVRTNLKRIARIDDELDNQIASTGFAVIRPSSHVDPTYIFYYLISEKFIDEITSLQRGASYPAVRPSDIFSRKITIAPLPEQKRIVAKLDSLFGHLDQLKARLENIPVLLKQFRQAVLTQAVTGKLTEEWRLKNEVASVRIHINQVIDRRRSLPAKKQGKTEIALRRDLDLNEIPKSWEWCDLDFLLDESDSFCYGVVQPGDNEDNQQKLIRIQDLENGKILTNELRGISWKIDKEYKRSVVKPNDLLISVVGTIGRTAIVSQAENGFNIARAVAKIPIKDFEVKYVKYFIDSDLGQQWLIADAREVARKTLNLEQLKTLPVPIPPIEEQKEIIRKVDSLFALADRIEASYNNLQEKIDHLPQAILAKAFRGELVEQEVSGKLKKYANELNDLSLAAEP